MALSEIQRAHVSKRLTSFCEARVPAAALGQLRIGFRIQPNDVVLFEQRPAFRPRQEWIEQPVAKFKYIATQNEWRLYCVHRDLRWHEYQRLSAAPTFDALLDEVANDPTGIFWG